MNEHFPHIVSPATGDNDENPSGITLMHLIGEDFRTHDCHLLEPGFIAIAVHRLGNARMGVRRKLLRAPLGVLYRAAFRTVDWVLGIELPYTVKLGRRVRIWHHGGMVLSAHSIGDDVHIRHNTTFGIARRNEPWDRPIIGDRVDLGVGTSVLGAVTIGDDSVIGAGAIVVRDIPAGTTAVGSPARVVRGAFAAEEPKSSESGYRFRAVTPTIGGTRGT